MKVAVVGTSNAIIKDSYISVIKSFFGAENVTNLSLGASAASFLPFRLNDEVFKEFDIIFVETLVNDAASYRAGGFNPSDLRPLLLWIVNKSIQFSFELIGLLIPGRRRDLCLEACYVEVVNMFREFGVRYLDGLYELDRLGVQDGIAYSERFVDAAHLKHELCSRLVSNFLLEVKDGGRLDFSLKLHELESDEFLFIPPKKGALDQKTYTVKNRVIDVEVFKFKVNSNVVIRFSSEFELWALVLDSSSTSCYLSVKGQQQISKELLYLENSKMNSIVVAPFVSKIRSDNGEVNLYIPEYELSEAEYTYQSKDSEIRNGELNLVGAIVRKVGS